MLPVQGKDKIVHFIFYFLFVYLWSKAFNNKKNFLILCIAISYGIIIEILQEVVTQSRNFDYFDILANTIGAVTAFFILNRNFFSSNK